MAATGEQRTIEKMAARTAARPQTSAEPRSPEQWVAAFIEGWREPDGGEAKARHFERILDPQVRLIQPQMPNLSGHAEFRSGFIAPMFALMPDLHGVVERWAVRGDTALIELTVKGTLGGRPAGMRVVDRVTVRDGLAVERESYTDPLPLLLTALRRPRAWPRMARFQVAVLRHHLKTRRRNR
jgi:ketosteroid isomerase-like protein